MAAWVRDDGPTGKLALATLNARCWSWRVAELRSGRAILRERGRPDWMDIDIEVFIKELAESPASDQATKAIAAHGRWQELATTPGWEALEEKYIKWARKLVSRG